MPGHPAAEIGYGELRAYEDANDDEYKVVIEGQVVKHSVKELLEGIDVPQRIRMDVLRLFTSPVRVFVSYSHKDVVFLDNLRGHLTPYERANELEVWADPLLDPGCEWKDEIFTHLDRAQIMILLVSSDALASKFCIEKELARAFELGIEVVPVVIRPCRYDKDLKLGSIQAILPGGKPVGEAKNDAAWVVVTRKLDLVIERVRKR